jgi:hypothetical protein
MDWAVLLQAAASAGSEFLNKGDSPRRVVARDIRGSDVVEIRLGTPAEAKARISRRQPALS